MPPSYCPKGLTGNPPMIAFVVQLENVRAHLAISLGQGVKSDFVRLGHPQKRHAKVVLKIQVSRDIERDLRTQKMWSRGELSIIRLAGDNQAEPQK
jgi:hypothetical protein